MNSYFFYRGETDNMLIAFKMIFKRYQYVQKEPVYIHLIEKGDESDKIQRGIII
jgi:hypothetical protein